jgi:nicotinamide-nucleotide amidase
MLGFPEPLLVLARGVLDRARQQRLRIATAESCTGGLIAGCLTAIPGSSDVVERGFVTYADKAKTELLGVSPSMIAAYGAVSEAVARAMAEGALARSGAELAVSCTGIAGPGGRTATKAIGTVHIAALRKSAPTVAQEFRFGDIGRDQVREKSVEAALKLLQSLL